MDRQNCWEFKQCGREPGGAQAAKLGVCPSAALAAADGINHGHNGGRSCWAISGTLGAGEACCGLAKALGSCMKCAFYGVVRMEEGKDWVLAKDILQKI